MEVKRGWVGGSNLIQSLFADAASRAVLGCLRVKVSFSLHVLHCVCRWVSDSLPLYLSVSVSLSLSLCLCVSDSLPLYLSVSVSLSLSLCLCVSDSLPLYLSVSVSLSLSLCLCVSDSLPLYLSVSVSDSLSLCPCLWRCLSVLLGTCNFTSTELRDANGNKLFFERYNLPSTNEKHTRWPLTLGRHVIHISDQWRFVVYESSDTFKESNGSLGINEPFLSWSSWEQILF